MPGAHVGLTGAVTSVARRARDEGIRTAVHAGKAVLKGRGSLAVATVILIAGIVMVLARPNVAGDPAPYRVFAPAFLCMLVWVFSASALIGNAIRIAHDFERRAGCFLGQPRTRGAPCFHQPRRILDVRSRWRYFAGYSFTALLITVCLAFFEDGWITALQGSVLLFCFFYGSFGLSGAQIVSQAVQDVCKRSERSLSAAHPDGLGGLGFVRTYADHAGLAVLSGVLAVPTAVAMVRLGTEQFNRHPRAASMLILLSTGALVSWVVIWAKPTITARVAIARTATRLQVRLLHSIIAERHELMELGFSVESTFQHRALEEKQAQSLATSFILGSGAWRDAVNIAVSILTAATTVVLEKSLGAP